MTSVRVNNFSISLDGYGAGPDQSARRTRSASAASGCTSGSSPPARSARCVGEDGGDDGRRRRVRGRAAPSGIGATIMGRNMFGPIRGAVGRRRLEGLVGRQPALPPPDVFVLTHQPRESDHRWRAARRSTSSPTASTPRSSGPATPPAARTSGSAAGVATIQQYLRAGLIDEMHLAIAPVLLGGGERLFDQLGDDPIGMTCAELVSTGTAVHARFVRSTS